MNVKSKVLSRLSSVSRLTQAGIIKSVDTMISPPKLGTCGHVTSQYGGPQSGRLLVFEGCDPALGGTIMLTGGDRRFLSMVVPLYTREQSELSGSDSVTGDTNQTEEIIKLRDPHNLNRLWARIMDPELGVKLETAVRARQWP